MFLSTRFLERDWQRRTAINGFHRRRTVCIVQAKRHRFRAVDEFLEKRAREEIRGREWKRVRSTAKPLYTVINTVFNRTKGFLVEIKED